MNPCFVGEFHGPFDAVLVRKLIGIHQEGDLPFFPIGSFLNMIEDLPHCKGFIIAFRPGKWTNGIGPVDATKLRKLSRCPCDKVFTEPFVMKEEHVFPFLIIGMDRAIHPPGLAKIKRFRTDLPGKVRKPPDRFIYGLFYGPYGNEKGFFFGAREPCSEFFLKGMKEACGDPMDLGVHALKVDPEKRGGSNDDRYQFAIVGDRNAFIPAFPGTGQKR